MLRGCIVLAAGLAMTSAFAAPDIEQPRLVYQVRPVYPKLAREARIQGTVRLSARISKEGTVDRLRLISGHPFLVKAAMDAVRQWRYRPMLHFGVPVSFTTEIEVPFSLAADNGGPVVHV